MAFRHMLGNGCIAVSFAVFSMAADSIAVTINLDQVRCGFYVHLFMNKSIRNRIIMSLITDMIIKLDFGFLPFGKFIMTVRKFKRMWLVQKFKKLSPALLKLLHNALIEFGKQNQNRCVQLGQ